MHLRSQASDLFKYTSTSSDFTTLQLQKFWKDKRETLWKLVVLNKFSMFFGAKSENKNSSEQRPERFVFFFSFFLARLFLFLIFLSSNFSFRSLLFTQNKKCHSVCRCFHLLTFFKNKKKTETNWCFTLSNTCRCLYLLIAIINHFSGANRVCENIFKFIRLFRLSRNNTY